MGQQDAEAAVAQLVRGRVKLFAGSLGRWFEQNPARIRGPDGDDVEVALVEASDHRVAELSAAVHVEVDPLASQSVAEFSEPLG